MTRHVKVNSFTLLDLRKPSERREREAVVNVIKIVVLCVALHLMHLFIRCLPCNNGLHKMTVACT